MNSIKKHFLTFTALALTSAAALALTACNANAGSAKVAFADSTPSVSIPEDSLEITQALQSTFRSISSQVLPAVVEVDVTETTEVKTYNPFGDIPWLKEWGFDFGDQGSTQQREQSSLGSGFIVRHKGNKYYVVTNNHVAGNASKITIKLNDEREFPGTLVGADARMDIALVSFESDDDSIAIATLGDSESVQTGDLCLALGSPMGYFASVTQGIISATGRSGSDIGSISDFIQTDAAINQGNSGGPLVNIYGEVIGINTWIVSQSGGSQGLGFSIPINNVKNAIDQFIDNGKIAYGWLGVQLVDVSAEYKDELGVGKETGAFASEVFLGSPAMKGGLQAGDYIVALNGHKIKTTDQLVREVGQLKAGESAEFTVMRGKNKVDLTVKIEERNDSVTNDSSKLMPGFIASPLTEDLRKQLELDKKVKGVVVSNITAKTPAAALRLQNGDVITAVNGKAVSNVEEFYAALDIASNSELWFDIYSDGHILTTAKYKIEK